MVYINIQRDSFNLVSPEVWNYTTFIVKFNVVVEKIIYINRYSSTYRVDKSIPTKLKEVL